MVVKAADGVENGADDGDGIVLGRLALCEGTVKGSPPVVSSEEGSILCQTRSLERQTMLVRTLSRR